MPATVPVPTKSPGDVLTSALWNTYVAGNINKLLNQAHRRLTVSQFNALTGIEDGDEVYLEVDATNGIEWHLVYDSSEPTYKWRFVGGPALIAYISTNETGGGTTATFGDFTTVGPSITLARAGDYDAEARGMMGGPAATTSYFGLNVGGTAPTTGTDRTWAVSGGATLQAVPGSLRARLTSLVANTVVKLQARDDDTTRRVSLNGRVLAITPVRLV